MRSTSLMVLCLLAIGCGQTREFQIMTVPTDASIEVNGRRLGAGSARVRMTFTEERPTNVVAVSRAGFHGARKDVTLASADSVLRFDLDPLTRPLEIRVEPEIEASILLDGKFVGKGPVFRCDYAFSLGANNAPLTQSVRVEAPNFAPVETAINWNDAPPVLNIALAPLTKDITIHTNIPGAHVFDFDGSDLGEGPITLKSVPFRYDPLARRFETRSVIAKAPGYPDAPFEMSWDDGQPEYTILIQPFSKLVTIETIPADALLIASPDSPPVETNQRTLTLEFPPNAESNLPSFSYDVTVEGTGAHEGELWKPAKLNIGWDGGQTRYIIEMEEILDRPTKTIDASFRLENREWKFVTSQRETIAKKQPKSGPSDIGRPVASRVIALPEGANVQSFAISPDGKRVALILLVPDGEAITTRLVTAASSGQGGLTYIGDGSNIDLSVAFSPDGKSIVFSSDRGGGRFNIWSVPVDGSAGATRLTGGNGDHLWPSLDAGKTPRVFYESRLPRQATSRLYSSVVGTTLETELTTIGGSHPRLSPDEDRVVFEARTSPERMLDLMIVGDKGGANVQKLTDTPNADEFDPAWSPDGGKIAFARSVRGSSDLETDVYAIDLKGNEITQLTINPGIDDMPVFDPIGDAVYFRSNRGGAWAIWRIALK